jgi:endonuclease/exonuclease/phosphatase family metal-dependent hydrolase
MSPTTPLAKAPLATLRIVSLNLWGGQAFEPLLDFVREHAPGTDLFCFQEMLDASELVSLACGFRTTLYREISAVMPDFAGAFDPVVTWDQPIKDGQPLRVPFGLATFARRGVPVLDRRAVKVIEHQDTLDAVPGLHPIDRWLQLTEFRVPDGTLLVGNYHGIARPGSKLDSDERLEQSRSIRRALDRHAGPVALIGDFNLLPDTESVRLLEAGLRNLVIERAIRSTRSRLNPYYGTPQEQPHADYVFISPGLRVTGFEVPDVSISDHLPMILDLAW